MTTVVLDSSCMVAAVCAWHVHHEATVSELEKRRRSRDRVAIAVPALLEAYSVLTRLPPSFRLSAAEAAHVLSANWG